MNATAVPAQPASHDSRSSGWWGMVLLIASEASLFLLLIAAYFYLRTRAHGSWPPAPLSDPKLLKPLLATAVLVASSVPLIVATRASRLAGRTSSVRVSLLAALAFGVAFLVWQWFLVRDQLDTFNPQGSAYGSIYYTLIGVHYAHVALAVLLGIWALLRAGRYTPERHLTLRVTALYWHFVNVVAVIVFLTLYVSPRG